MKISARTTGVLFSLAGAILISTKAIFVKLAFAQSSTDALSLLMVRMLFALPFYVAAAFWVSRQPQRALLTPRQWGAIALMGILGYYLSSLFDFMGLQYISAGLERLVLFTYPTLSLLISAYFFKQKLHWRQIVALLLSYGGILLAFFGELQLDNNNPNFFWGSTLVFMCAVTFAIYISASSRLIPQVGASRFTAFAMLAATLGIFIHFALRGQYGVFQQGGQLWAYGLALGLVATVLPTFLLSAGMKQIGGNNAAIISSIGPLSTILQAHYFLGEKIFWQQLAGTALVLAGVFLLSFQKAK